MTKQDFNLLKLIKKENTILRDIVSELFNYGTLDDTLSSEEEGEFVSFPNVTMCMPKCDFDAIKKNILETK